MRDPHQNCPFWHALRDHSKVLSLLGPAIGGPEGRLYHAGGVHGRALWQLVLAGPTHNHLRHTINHLAWLSQQ